MASRPTWKPVASTAVQAVRYNPDTQALDVRYVNGRAYRYQGATPAQGRGVQRAASAGGYVNRNVKRLPFRRLPS